MIKEKDEMNDMVRLEKLLILKQHFLILLVYHFIIRINQYLLYILMNYINMIN